MILEYFKVLFTDNTLQMIALGTAILGAVSGVLGSFAVLRKQSLLGDAISHAALPGIVIVFLITLTKDNISLLIGAFICGLIGTLLVNGITKRTKLKMDTSLGVILSVFFGFGMLLLTYVQKKPNINQSGLDKYLFGQVATVMQKDVLVLGVFFIVSLVFIYLFWKELKLMLFDLDYAKTIGIKIIFLDLSITFLIVLVIVLGLQTVGVVLMSALLIAPATAARQWTDKLSTMLFLSALFGAVSGVIGTIIGDTTNNLPTGPVIVIVAVSIVVFSLLFAPKRGVVYKIRQNRLNRYSFILQNELMRLYNYTDETQHFIIDEMKQQKKITPWVKRELLRLEWLAVVDDSLEITSAGVERVEKFKKEILSIK